jgi:hypothetical protein
MHDPSRIRRAAARLERALDQARTIDDRVGIVEEALWRERRITLEQAKVDLAHLDLATRDYVNSRLRVLEDDD